MVGVTREGIECDVAVDPFDSPGRRRGRPIRFDRQRDAARARAGTPIGRLLRDAEQEMTRAQRRRDHLAEELSTTLDHAELARIGSELAAAQAELDQSSSAGSSWPRSTRTEPASPER